MSLRLPFLLSIALTGCAPAALEVPVDGGVPFSTGLYDVSGTVDQTDCEGFIAPPGYDDPEVVLEVAPDGHVGVTVGSLFGNLPFYLSPSSGYAGGYPHAACGSVDHVHLALASSTKDHVVFHEHEAFDYDGSGGDCVAAHTGLTHGCTVDRTIALAFVHACSNDPLQVIDNGSDCL